MSDDSAIAPFHVWMPTTTAIDDVSALELASDGDTVELVFVMANGRGDVHRLSRDDFADWLALAVRQLLLHPRMRAR